MSIPSVCPDEAVRRLSNPDYRSGFDGDGNWRQVLDWQDAHIVDHGGSLWIWQPEGGYLFSPEHCFGPVFYDPTDVYGDDG